jgi:hypothetical protein
MSDILGVIKSPKNKIAPKQLFLEYDYDSFQPRDRISECCSLLTVQIICTMSDILGVIEIPKNNIAP